MNRKFSLPLFLLIASASLAVIADDVDTVEIVGTRSSGSSNSTTNYPNGSTNTPTPSSGVNQGPNFAAAKAVEAAAAERGKLLDACGAKRERIKTFTNTYQTCNSNTQLAYNTSFGDCPEAVQDTRSWGIKTKDGTTWGYSREYAQNFGLQCRTDASTIYTTTLTNVCLANYNADKEAEGQLSQFCKDAGF